MVLLKFFIAIYQTNQALQIMYKHILRKLLGLSHFRFLKSFLEKYTKISATKLEAAEQKIEEICNELNLAQEELSKREKVHQQVSYYSFYSQKNF